jgi:prepilin peptidase CpaA
MVLVFTVVFCTLIALGFGAAAAWSDYARLIIPNPYVILVALAFVPAFLTVTYFTKDVTFFSNWQSHAIAGVMVFIITYALFHFNMLGGGDAKLISAFALWVGLSGLMSFLFFMALAGGLLGVATILLGKWKPVKKPVKGSWIYKAQAGKKEVPYGIAIFIGALVSFWHTGYLKPNELVDIALVGGGF